MAGLSEPPHGRIFISYRREETAYPAAWLFSRLRDHFGQGQIFKDVDSIELGDDFVEVISDAVGSCDVLLALIGDEWVTMTDDDGRRRLDNPDDFVRVEIEAALARRVRVVPILVAGATMPSADDLPPSLAPLVRRQALELSPTRFDSDAARLVRVLEKTLAEVQSGSAQDARKAEVPARATEGSTSDQRRIAAVESRPGAPEGSGRERRQRGRHGPMRLGLVVGAAVAVASVAVLVAVVLPGNGDGVAQRDVEVDGTKSWTNTEIDVRTGDEVQITARGTIFHNELSSIGPEGFPNRPDLLTPLDRANHAGLLARVGDTGEPFYVGRATSFTADRDGRLFLGINDGGLENNRGFFSATVEVRRDSDG